jgi:hypothetical protein
MGGNYRYDLDGKLISGNSLKFKSENARNRFIADIKEMLSALNDGFSSMFGKLLWPELESYFSDLLIFGGSTEHIVDPSISDEDFSFYKETFSDLDIYIPQAGERGSSLIKFLDQNKGSMLGSKFKIIGTKIQPNENVANDRGTNTIFQYVDGKGNPYIQFDFMPQPIPVQGEDEKTSKALKSWVKLSHSSNWRDVQQSVKGVFHKYLLQSLVSIRSRVSGHIATPASTKEKLRLVKEPGPDLHMQSLAVDKGLGTTRLTKQDYEHEGQPVYKVTQPSEKKYVTDAEKIFEAAFGFSAEPEDLEKMRSFLGLLDIMRENLLPDPEGRKFCGKVLKSFLYKLIGDHGQEISTYSEAKDIKPKAAAVAAIRSFGFDDVLNEVLPPEEIEAMLEKYYKRFKLKMADRGSLASDDEELAPVELEEGLRRLIRGILNA